MSGKHCTVCGDTEMEVKKLFCFPSTEERCIQWFEILGFAYRGTARNYKICEKHFSNEQFMDLISLKLHRDAVPMPWLGASLSAPSSQLMCFVNYDRHCDFSIQNLPYGVFSTNNDHTHRIGVAIGDFILDLKEISHLFNGPLLKNQQDVFRQPILNYFMALEEECWKEARQTLQHLLSYNIPTLRDNTDLKARAFVKQDEATMHLPAHIGDFTDFYSSIKVQSLNYMFRSEESSVSGNWMHVPIGYHGRASSIVVSGTPIHRPRGLTSVAKGTAPVFGISKMMDFELEVAFFVGGKTNPLGQPIPVQKAHQNIFGFVLMNDWCARDIQKWEYVPLGPFTAKNVGTSISPWVVTTLALEPFLVDNYPQYPKPFPYLQHDDRFNFNISLEVDLKPQYSDTSTTICRSNYKNLYWTPKQQLAQHTITGCNMKPGDLLASGVISGEAPDSLGSFDQLSWRSTEPLRLNDGSLRKFLHDGDTVIMRGRCEGYNFNVGFGTCEGKLLPAIQFRE